MAKFITRVELHGALERDYENLHMAMRKQGFSQTITSDTGKIYNLPPAEYRLSDNIARSEVLRRAKGATASTGRNAEVIVVEYTSCSWDGLTS